MGSEKYKAAGGDTINNSEVKAVEILHRNLFTKTG